MSKAEKTTEALAIPDSSLELGTADQTKHQQLVEMGFRDDIDVITLPEGEYLVAYYCGMGDPVDIQDPLTAEFKTLDTELFEREDGSRIGVISATQLRKKLSRIEPGTLVYVERYGQQDSKAGRRFSLYKVRPHASKRRDV